MTLLKTEKGEDVGLPKGWIRETYSRTGKKKTYFVWIDPEKKKYRSMKNVTAALNAKSPKKKKKKHVAEDFVLPPGWTSVKHTRGNGMKYHVFMSPSGVKYRSMAAVTRAIEGGAETSSSSSKKKKKKKKKTQTQNPPSNLEMIWVRCDAAKCQKWRQIPKPKECLPVKWYCRMNTYNPSLASCDAPEDSAHETEDVAVATATATFQRGAFTRSLRVRISSGGQGKVRNEEKQQSLISILDALQPVKPLKPGWRAVEHIRHGNKKYFHYHGPNGSLHRSYVVCCSLTSILSTRTRTRTTTTTTTKVRVHGTFHQ